MSTHHQSNNEPIGFPQNAADPTKGGSVSTSQPTTHNSQLSAFEERAIACFVEIATGFNLPRSTGEIFGLLYASPEPVPFDGVKERLKLSKASTSTGLKFLQRLGAVKSVYVGGDRRSFYEPEGSMEQLVSGLMNETLMPHLKTSSRHIDEMRQLLPANQNNGHKVLEERLDELSQWQGKANQILPIVLRLGR